MGRRLFLGCLAATVVGASLSAHGHEAAPGAGRDSEAADAAAPAFGTVIDFELTDASGNRVRAVDLRGRWLLIFFGYSVLQRLTKGGQENSRTAA